MIKDKNSKQKLERRSVVMRVGAIVGLIGGLFGIFGGGMVMWDRFIPPQLKVLEVLPVCLISEFPCKNCPKPLPPSFPIEGIGAIVQVRGGNRTTFVGGLDILGKIYLSQEEFSGVYVSKNNDDIKNILNQWDTLKPFIKIAWNGWSSDSQTAIRVEPFEEKFIRFTFLEPVWKWRVRCDDVDEIFFKAKSNLPLQTSSEPFVEDIFVGYYPRLSTIQQFKLRKEVKSGLVEFQLRVGPKAIKISKEKIREVRRINKEDWEKLSAQKLYLEK